MWLVLHKCIRFAKIHPCSFNVKWIQQLILCSDKSEQSNSFKCNNVYCESWWHKEPLIFHAKIQFIIIKMWTDVNDVDYITSSYVNISLNRKFNLFSSKIELYASKIWFCAATTVYNASDTHTHTNAKGIFLLFSSTTTCCWAMRHTHTPNLFNGNEKEQCVQHGQMLVFHWILWLIDWSDKESNYLMNISISCCFIIIPVSHHRWHYFLIFNEKTTTNYTKCRHETFSFCDKHKKCGKKLACWFR